MSAMTPSRAPNADDTVLAILEGWSRAARVFLDRGMHCVGCAIAPFETMTEACAIYGIPVEELLVDVTRQDEPEGKATP
jgi:hybrid cluster-associated redox disulfide protein